MGKIEKLLQASITHINGRETPELVPYNVRMQHFFEFYRLGSFKTELESQLSAADLAVLTDFSFQLVQEKVSNNRNRHGSHILCRGLQTATYSVRVSGYTRDLPSERLRLAWL